MFWVSSEKNASNLIGRKAMFVVKTSQVFARSFRRLEDSSSCCLVVCLLRIVSACNCFKNLLYCPSLEKRKKKKFIWQNLEKICQWAILV